MATCYRHPDRETATSCTRCGRPICPACLTPAPVGYHCPSCVHEAARSSTPVKTSVGARVANQPRAIQALIALNVLAYVGEQSDATVIGRFGMQPAAIATSHQYYRLLTAAFLHAGLLHIGFNMLALWIFGTQLERMLGWPRLLVLYVVAAVGGSTASYVLSSPRVLGVGASGAVFGLFGAYFVIARRVRADTGGIVGLILINILFGFTYPHIDNWAHVGGLLTGGLVAMAYAHVPPGRAQLLLQAAAVAAVAAALVAIIAARTSALSPV